MSKKMTPEMDLTCIDPDVLKRAKARATKEVRHCDKNRETLARHILKYQEHHDLVFYAVEYLMQAYRDDPLFFTEEVERVLGEEDQDPVEFVLDTDGPAEIARYLRERGLEEGTAAFNDVLIEKLNALFPQHEHTESGGWANEKDAAEWVRAEAEVYTYLNDTDKE